MSTMRPDLEKELNEKWKEKVALETTKDETEDPFIPAKIAIMDKDNSLIHVEL